MDIEPTISASMMQTKYIWQIRRCQFADSSNPKPHLHPNFYLPPPLEDTLSTKTLDPNRLHLRYYTIISIHIQRISAVPGISGLPIPRFGALDTLARVCWVARDIPCRHQKRTQIDGYTSAVLHELSVSGMVYIALGRGRSRGNNPQEDI
jgi:hypothetical protein